MTEHENKLKILSDFKIDIENIFISELLLEPFYLL